MVAQDYRQKYRKYLLRVKKLRGGRLYNPDGIEYLAVFLPPSEQRRLRIWWEQHVGPIMSKPSMDHLTIAYNPTVSVIQKFQQKYGVTYPIQVSHWVSSDILHAQAVLATTEIKSQNRYPHITIATDGITPKTVLDQLLSHATTHNPIVEAGEVNNLTLSGRFGKFIKRPDGTGYISYVN